MKGCCDGKDHIRERRLARCAESGPSGPVKATKVHDRCCEQGWLYPELHDVAEVTKCPGKANL